MLMTIESGSCASSYSRSAFCANARMNSSGSPTGADTAATPGASTLTRSSPS